MLSLEFFKQTPARSYTVLLCLLELYVYRAGIVALHIFYKSWSV